MRLADRPVQKRNYEEYGGDGPHFCTVEEGLRHYLERYGAGKLLVVSDALSYAAAAPCAARPRVLSLVYDGEALALFAMPDDVVCVLAVGGKAALLAARYFSCVRKIPCGVFPSAGTLFGAYERRAEIKLFGEARTVDLPACEVFFDLNSGFSLSEAYAQVYLSRLALFEERALCAFRGQAFTERAWEPLGNPDRKKLIAVNAALRQAEADGAPVGEGRILAELYEKDGNKRPVYRAFTELLALYYAFFKRGVPRPYFIPDYAARARAAGVPYFGIEVPEPSEYASRALALEKMRSERQAEISAVLEDWRKCPFCLRQAASLIDLKYLKLLPEYGGGLTAIIRDFGLLD